MQGLAWFALSLCKKNTGRTEDLCFESCQPELRGAGREQRWPGSRGKAPPVVARAVAGARYGDYTLLLSAKPGVLLGKLIFGQVTVV